MAPRGMMIMGSSVVVGAGAAASMAGLRAGDLGSGSMMGAEGMVASGSMQQGGFAPAGSMMGQPGHTSSTEMPPGGMMGQFGPQAAAGFVGGVIQGLAGVQGMSAGSSMAGGGVVEWCSMVACWLVGAWWRVVRWPWLLAQA